MVRSLADRTFQLRRAPAEVELEAAQVPQRADPQAEVHDARKRRAPVEVELEVQQA